MFFWDSLAFSMIQQMLAIWSLVPLPFLKPLLKPGLENFEDYFTSVWDECNCVVVWAFFDIAFLWDWNAKVGSQETPRVTGKFGLGIRNEAGQRLIEFCQENSLIIANTLFQHKRRIYTWTSPDGQHWNQIEVRGISSPPPDLPLEKPVCRSGSNS